MMSFGDEPLNDPDRSGSLLITIYNRGSQKRIGRWWRMGNRSRRVRWGDRSWWGAWESV